MGRSRVDNSTAAAAVWQVHSITSRKRTTHPPLPYKTSTLQQEAVRRLGLPVQVTMRAAQQLYEAGCISYMRTDSTVLSRDAQQTVERTVTELFGAEMLSSDESSRRRSTAKQPNDKFAQEAHEAIRPAIQANGQFLTPDRLPPQLANNGAAAQVYRMIYQRTLAHRMPPLVTNQTQVVLSGRHGETELHFRTSGSVVVSPGYTLAYHDDSPSPSEGGDDSPQQQLPPLVEGQRLALHALYPVGHETQPPPRYTEASFVKELEALGVGRPSTYAHVVQILRDRAYVGSPVSSDSGGGASRQGRPVGTRHQCRAGGRRS